MKMKRYLFISVLIVLLTVFIVGGCAQQQAPPTAQEPATRKPGSGAQYQKPPLSFQGAREREDNFTQEAILPYLEGLNEGSGGRLKILYYGKDSLVPSTALMDGIASNSPEMGVVSLGVERGKYPLTEVVSLPFVAPSSTIASLVAWHLYNKFPGWRSEFPPEVKVLSHFVSDPFQIHTVDKPVKTVDDLRGMKIMTLSSWGVKVLEKAGAIPQQVPVADVYQGLQQGMAEGLLAPLTLLRPLRVSEIVKHHTIINLNYDLFAVAINLGAFESLPAELQQLMVGESGAKFAEAAAKALDEGALSDADGMVGQGATFYTLPEAEMKKFAELVLPIREEWVAETEAKGLPGRAALDEALRYGEELAAQGKFIPAYPAE